MITGYDPARKIFKSGIGSFIDFGRLPDSLVPSENPLSIHERQRVHSAFQRKKLKEGWQKEIPVSLEFSFSDIRFEIRGRMDLLLESNGSAGIIEVKTLHGKPEFRDPVLSRTRNALQLYFYTKAFSASKNVPMKKITSSLVYLSMDRKNPTEYTFALDLHDERLEKSWRHLLEEISDYLKGEDKRKENQISSLKKFHFPYDSLRPGQQDILTSVDKCINDKGYLILQAPTGTGKTAAVLTGALRNTIPERNTLFFLTAKNTHKLIVYETLGLIIDKGVPLRAIIITARSQVCHRGRSHCFPDDCPYASDFGAKVRGSEVMKDLLDLRVIGPEELTRLALQAGVCAFELGLQLAMRCDIVVCDYNYVFDPHVFLKRFFLERSSSEKCCILIDEAANLPSRAREYYSPEIRLSWITELLDDPACPRNRVKLLEPWLDGFREWKALLENSEKDEIELPSGTEFSLNPDRWFRHMSVLKDPPESLRELFKAIVDFSKITANSNVRNHLLFRNENGDHVLQWFCTDPSEYLRERLADCNSTVAFSATLTPFEHFRHLLGFPCGEKTVSKIITWPFPRENLGVWIIPEIDTRYGERRDSAGRLKNRISEIFSMRPGSWLVFFPSYAYLKQVCGYFEDSGIPLLIQTPEMNREERRSFIERIESGNHLVMTVSGGIFSEGIDLRSPNLLGAMIVGPSLPGMNLRMKLLSESFEIRGKDAFIHTWAIPGIVRVIQAAGRLIRNSSERRVLILIGRRFTKYPYLGLLPEHWFRKGMIPLISGGVSGIDDFLQEKKGGTFAPPLFTMKDI